MTMHDELVKKIDAIQASQSEPIKCFHFGRRVHMELRMEAQFARGVGLSTTPPTWYGIPYHVDNVQVDRMDIELEKPLDSYEIGLDVLNEMIESGELGGTRTKTNAP
jgi:hypothetical protein